jgi:hypothetical protein
MTTKQCLQCGAQFEGRANKLYCSSKCKMTAFYSPPVNEQNSLTFNEFPGEQGSEPLTDNGLSVNRFEKPLNVKPKKEETGMVIVPVSFTVQEKELLEKQAGDCETVLPKLIRIRCLMDETDFQEMRQLIDQQKQQLEELRVKLSFYQEHESNANSVKRITDKSLNGLLIHMNEKQIEFLTKKYLESYDYESDDTEEMLPDGTLTHNQRKALEAYEKEYPGHIINSIEGNMLYSFLSQIEERLVDHCGHSQEKFLDDPIIDEFENLE